jgi:HEAT repeat protein
MAMNGPKAFVAALAFSVVNLALALNYAGAEAAPHGSAQDDAAKLVNQLPFSGSFSSVELEKRIAALGTAALPALERELHLGIRFKALNELLQAKASRRAAVASVLAQIPGEASTSMLVKALADPADNYGMTVVILQALKQRTLSEAQVLALLSSTEPMIVLASMQHADARATDPSIKAALERIFDKDAATVQFHNEYGAATANPDALWEVRLASGKALGKGMLPEIRDRAAKLIADLRQEALHPTAPNQAVFMSSASQAELTICSCLAQLYSLGEPARRLVEDAARTADGNYAKTLDMALARFGDRKSLAKVANHLTAADSPDVRYCSAVTLRMVRDKSVIPALRRALRDTYQRLDGSCVRSGDPMIYPVRVVAADALIDLGEEPKKIREEMWK